MATGQSYGETEMSMDDYEEGDKVIYIPNHAGDRDINHPDCERGVVTSLNDKFVFVRYRKQHADSNGQATLRTNLKLDGVSMNKILRHITEYERPNDK